MCTFYSPNTYCIRNNFEESKHLSRWSKIIDSQLLERFFSNIFNQSGKNSKTQINFPVADKISSTKRRCLIIQERCLNEILCQLANMNEIVLGLFVDIIISNSCCCSFSFKILNSYFIAFHFIWIELNELHLVLYVYSNANGWILKQNQWNENCANEVRLCFHVFLRNYDISNYFTHNFASDTQLCVCMCIGTVELIWFKSHFRYRQH